MKSLNLILPLFLLIVSLDGNSQPTLKSHNLAHQYDPESEIDVKFFPFRKNDSLEMNLAVSIRQPRASFTSYSFNFYTVDSYSDKLQPIPPDQIDSLYTGASDGNHLLKFITPSAGILSMIIIEVQSKFSGFNYFFDFPSTDYPLALQNEAGILQFNRWVSPGIYQFTQSEDLKGYYYNHDFPPALPPMPVRNVAPEKSLQVDSTFVIEGNDDRSFSRTGLYLIQLDSADRKGLGYRVEGEFYPRLVTLESLTQPLIYITTKEENQQLQNVDGEKQAFDRFWLELTGSEERARNIIKYYFQRVEEANRLFTSYKEGWKTDMGMIYIIFGPPDEVNKSDQGISWHYLAVPNAPALQFDFIKTETIFATSYVLVRDKKYTNAWYRSVDQWRKGRF